MEQLRDICIAENVPVISEKSGMFLASFVSMVQAKHVLEVGCAWGYSTLWLASAVREIGGSMKTIDFSKPSCERAREHFKEAGMDDVIDLVFGDAIDVIPNVSEIFDVVFVDGAIKDYVKIFEALDGVMSCGAFVFFDNVKKFPEKSKYFLDYMEQVDSFQWLMVPVSEDDAMLMGQKK